MSVISGVVTRPNGTPVSGATVSAAVGGLLGGVTDRVSTDSSGRFLLTYSHAGAADIVYCNGQEAARNVASGTNSLHLIAR